MPSLVGKLPTITHPLCSTTNAVVKPMPPGQGPGNLVGIDLSKQSDHTFGRNLHDRRTRTLEIRAVVEIADQNISLD